MIALLTGIVCNILSFVLFRKAYLDGILFRDKKGAWIAWGYNVLVLLAAFFTL